VRNAPRITALLMALQAASAWSLPTGVLCLSQDGHVALETFDSTCCHPEEHVGESEARLVLTSTVEGCCGPCVNIPLPQASAALHSGVKAGLAPPPPPLATWPLARLPVPVSSSSLRWTAALPPPPTALRALRTVVLTC